MDERLSEERLAEIRQRASIPRSGSATATEIARADSRSLLGEVERLRIEREKLREMLGTAAEYLTNVPILPAGDRRREWLGGANLCVEQISDVLGVGDIAESAPASSPRPACGSGQADGGEIVAPQRQWIDEHNRTVRPDLSISGGDVTVWLFASAKAWRITLPLHHLGDDDARRVRDWATAVQRVLSSAMPTPGTETAPADGVAQGERGRVQDLKSEPACDPSPSPQSTGGGEDSVIVQIEARDVRVGNEVWDDGDSGFLGAPRWCRVDQTVRGEQVELQERDADGKLTWSSVSAPAHPLIVRRSPAPSSGGGIVEIRADQVDEGDEIWLGNWFKVTGISLPDEDFGRLIHTADGSDDEYDDADHVIVRRPSGGDTEGERRA